MISLSKISLNRGSRRLCDGLDWELPDPGVYLVLGGNGAGKSLLAALLGGRCKPQRGLVAIDGMPLYNLWHGYRQPVFYSRAEQALHDESALGDYLGDQLALFGAGLEEHKPLWQALYAVLSCAPDTPVAALSHGQLLLAQIALACAAPVRLALLDGHLAYLDPRYCAQAAEWLSPKYMGAEKFIVAFAARVPGPLPELRATVLLAEQPPLRLTPLANAGDLDANLVPLTGRGALRIHWPPTIQPLHRLTSGAHYVILNQLEHGLRVEARGSADQILAELGAHGITVSRLEWESPVQPN